MFNIICPVLNVKNAKLAAAFYSEQLGFKIEFDYDTYISIIRDKVRIHLSEVPEAEAGHGGAYVYVDNVDVLHKNITAPVGEMVNQYYGMREFVITDLDGNHLRFGHHTDGAVL